jgi:hypothetical protein
MQALIHQSSPTYLMNGWTLLLRPIQHILSGWGVFTLNGEKDVWKILEDIIANFVDGEAETLVDNAFADFIFDFPRMQALSEAAFLRQKIGRLEQEQCLIDRQG